MAKALILAHKSGPDPKADCRAIRGGSAGRTALGDKDPANALAAVHLIGVPLLLTGQAMEVVQALKVQGKVREDHDGVIKPDRTIAGAIVRKPAD